MTPGPLRQAAGALLLLALAGAPAIPCPVAAAAGDENRDIDLIPQEAAPSAPEHAAGGSQRIFVEDAFTLWKLRSGLEVPLPPPSPPHWQDRLLLDARKEWRLGERASFAYSGRLNLRAEDDLSFPTHEAISHDFREGYVSWEAAPRVFIDAGRINLKSGVAAGFNPTDYFKTRAVVLPLSADPAVLREDRLGTLMLRAQRVWDGGAFTAAFAPGLYQATRLYSNVALPSFNPMFDRTNAHSRLLLKGNVDIATNFSPELLMYREGSAARLGVNLTASLGQRTVAYLEWSGGRRASLAEQALSYGYQTGTFPVAAPSVLPHDPTAHFRNDLSVGASYTSAAKITFNIEYHYHEAGFSTTDWNHWFAIGHAAAAVVPVTQQLWYLRAYALEQQESVARHTLFARFDWVDAFVPKLELTGFIDADLHDASSLIQLTADYYLSNAWTLGMVASASLGGARSNYGSIAQEANVLLKAIRYY
jgi:hypothetical protein